MNKLLTIAVIVFFILIHGSPGHSLPPVPMARPTLAIDGQIKPDLTMDLTFLAYDSRLNKLDVTLNNPLDPYSGRKYSDGTLLVPGVKIALYLGPSGAMTKVFEGPVSTLAPVFNKDGSSTFTISSTSSPRPSSKNQITVNYGMDLQSFSPVLASGRGTISCTGITSGNPDIHNGATLMVRGVGQKYSVSYTVSSTVHQFDLTTGYTTRFIASTRGAQLKAEISVSRPLLDDPDDD